MSREEVVVVEGSEERRMMMATTKRGAEQGPTCTFPTHEARLEGDVEGAMWGAGDARSYRTDGRATSEQ